MAEFIRQQRREILLECIAGLEAVQREQGLSPLGRAALEAIQRLYTRGGNVTFEEMKNPVAAAHRLIAKAGVTCAHW